MSIPTTRSAFKEYCLRQLGKPVIKINVDDSQVEDCIDDALNHFVTYHYDGMKHVYITYLLETADINRGYLDTTDNGIDPQSRLMSITGIWPTTSRTLSAGDFDVQYQYALHHMHDLSKSGLIEYEQMRQHLSLIDRMFSGERSTRFHRVDNKLHIDVDWGKDIVAGDYIIIEGYAKIDENTSSPYVWNSIFLKKYCTALIKKAWGSNMKKFDGVQLPGGVTLNGQQIHDEAVQELEKLEEQMQLFWEPPFEFFLG